MRDPTTIATGHADDASAGRVLIIAGEAQFATRALPDDAALVVGRDDDCDVVLVHPKISRRHARFHGGPPVEIEDLGSTNGVRVGGRKLGNGERAALTHGQSAQLGPFVAVVLEASHPATSDAPPMAAIPILDPTMAGVPEVVRRVAQGAVSVLLSGETGAGKEVLARTVHELSGREGPFVAISCATLGETLLESELFGHERGAFTGATGAKPGLFEVARGGTLLLDEIGELPLPLQAKLLRVLETREVYRLGGIAPVKLEVRFLAATHRDLAQDVADGRFRRDLYFRVNGITLRILPLRDRADIHTLAEKLLQDAARAAGRPPPRLTSRAMTALLRHSWPGNVRELRTVLERALLVSDRGDIDVRHILFDRLPEPAPRGDEERDRFAAAAAAHRGNVTAMAESLGTSRSQVRRLAQRHHIDLERYR